MISTHKFINCVRQIEGFNIAIKKDGEIPEDLAHCMYGGVTSCLQCKRTDVHITQPDEARGLRK